MISVVDPEECGYETLPSVATPATTDGDCRRCAAHRAGPQSDGTLEVDPEIHLPSPGMDVDIAYYYNSNSTYNGPFGYGRTINLNLRAQASGAFRHTGGAGVVVTLTRGNGARVSYTDDPSGAMVPSTAGLLNTLEADQAHGVWRETTPEGISTIYPLSLSGAVTTVLYAQDAVGNTHTFSYAGGLLQYLEDAAGRRVTLLYASTPSGIPVLETIRDWAGRLTTFSYDTASLPGKNLLRQVEGPSGCQTAFAYGPAGRLNLILDPNGYRTTYSYDKRGRVIQRTAASTYHTGYRYTDTAMVVTDALGRVTTYLHDTAGGQPHATIGGTVNPGGAQWIRTRNHRGEQTSLRNPDGGIWTTLYDSAGIPSGIVDPLNRRTTIVRDAYHNPVEITYADGAVATTVYGFAGSTFDTTGAKRKIQAKVNELGYRTSWTYNRRGQAVTKTDSLGYVVTFGYDAYGNRTSRTDQLGRTTTWVYDAAGNVVATVDPMGYRSSASYDAQDRMISQTDALGNITSYGYDSVGNMTVRMDAMGHRTTWTYNVFDRPVVVVDAMGARTTTVYDAIARPVAVIDALGHVTTTLYDLAGNAVSLVNPLGYVYTSVYDGSGRTVVSVDPLGHRSTVVYDVAGQAVTTQDALGYRTSYTYDARARRIGTIDPLGYRGTVVYDKVGNVVVEINALGYRTSYAYDPRGVRIGTQDARGYLSTKVYDPAGQLMAEVDALGGRTTHTYTLSGYRRSIQDARGHITSFVRDAIGQRVCEISALGYRTSFSYDSTGRLLSEVDPLGCVTSFILDAVGRVICEVNPLGYRSTASYDSQGQMVASTNALGYVTTTTYDVVGQVVSVQDALGHRTSFVYDHVGRRVTTLSPRGDRWTTLYDPIGRRLIAEDPFGALTTFQYNAVDVENRVDARGRITTFVHDGLGRIVQKLDPSGTHLTYLYSSLALPVVMSDSTGTTTYTYDARDRLTSLASPSRVVVTYGYDAVDNQILVLDSVGGLTTYSYDAQNRVESVINSTNERTTFTYDSVDHEVRRDYANGMYCVQQYDAAGRRTLVETLDSSDAIIFKSEAGTINPVGLITSAVEQEDLDYSNITYSYDAIGQVVREERSGVSSYDASYSYDASGNRITKLSESPLQPAPYLCTSTFDIADELVTTQCGSMSTHYTYDDDGNLVRADGIDAEDSFDYQWNDDSLLVQVSRDDGLGEWNYVYSGDGLRYSVDGPDGAVWYIWDGQNLQIEVDRTVDVLARYTYCPTTYGLLISQYRNGSSSFYAFDLQDNVRALIGKGGRLSDVTDRYNFAAFGEEISASGATLNPFRFGGAVGYYTDPGQANVLGRTARVYVRARYYDIGSGRWMSRDPLGFEDEDFNLYRYAWNNPIENADPSGLIARGQHKPCPSSPPGACFQCTYKQHSQDKWCPQRACEAANRQCRSHVVCQACGPGAPKPFRSNCTPSTVGEYADYLRGSSTSQGSCGGYDGADKVAHCWAACMARRCGTIAGYCVFKLAQRRETDPNDTKAENFGSDCSNAPTSWTSSPNEGIARACLDCCAKKTYNMECY